MKAERLGRNAIRSTHSAVNFVVLTIIVLSIAFAGYALWDSNQLHQAADKLRYAKYKPTEQNGGKTFKELQEINPDVFAWLSVYGTNIDYPIVQGQDNMKYVNTNAENGYSLSGALFLDSDNNKDFSDWGSIIYGHHMEKNKMFGQIGNFREKEMFESHRYGNLYFDGKEHGVEFFAFVHADAYNTTVFNPKISQQKKQAYLDEIYSMAIHKRDIGVTTKDKIVLLSTCSASSTNGRDVLIGKISDEVFPDTTQDKNTNDTKDKSDNLPGYVQESLWLLLLLILMIILIVIRLTAKALVHYNKKTIPKREI